MYDDEDFDSKAMCCACGGGEVPEDQGDNEEEGEGQGDEGDNEDEGENQDP